MSILPVKEDYEKDDCKSMENKDTSVRNLNKQSPANRQKGADCPMKFCISKIDEVIHQLYDIMICSDECSESDHARHHEFLRSFSTVCARERRKHAFGTNAFDHECVEWVLYKLKEALLVNRRGRSNPYTDMYSTIKNLTECSLTETFRENKMLAQDYIMYVMVKEALVLLRAMQVGCPYETANEFCMLSELDKAQMMRNKKKHISTLGS